MIELLNMDCMEYMKGCEDNAFDLIVTSPPYDDLREYGGFDWSREVQQKIISGCFRVLKNGGVMVWNVADAVRNGSETGTSFKQALFAIDCGFNLHDTMIWHKDSFSFPEANRYPQCFEYMFIFSKGRPSVFNPIKDRVNKYAGTKIHGTWRQSDGSVKSRSKTENQLSAYGQRHNVWNMSTVKTARESDHPAQFPVGLAFDHMTSWAIPGSRVLDPFLGSGSSAIAAHYFGADFVGTEIDEDYYKAACERFERETAQLDLLA